MCAVCVNALAIHHRQAAISLYSHVLCMNMATSVLHCTLDYTTSSLALACGMPMRCVAWNKTENFISSLFGCATGGKLLWKIRKTRRFVATHANACVCVYEKRIGAYNYVITINLYLAKCACVQMARQAAQCKHNIAVPFCMATTNNGIFTWNTHNSPWYTNTVYKQFIW